MQDRRGGRAVGLQSLEFGASRLESLDLLGDGPGGGAVDDGLDQPVEVAADLRQFPIALRRLGCGSTPQPWFAWRLIKNRLSSIVGRTGYPLGPISSDFHSARSDVVRHCPSPVPIDNIG